MQNPEKVICRELLTEDQNYRVLVFDEKPLGKGAYGQCFLGFYPAKGQLVVIKKIYRKPYKMYKAFEKDYEREVKNLNKASQSFRVEQFSNIVNVQPIKIISQQKTHAYMIMQYCQGGSLQNLMQNMMFEDTWFTFQNVCTIMLDLLDGYNQLYSVGIIHQDLKPDNIFINQNKFKIGDFGLSFKLNDEQIKLGGTPSYNAPQKYKKYKLNVKSDIYALGIIFYELIYNEHPYYTTKQQLQFQNKKAELQIEGMIKGKYQQFTFKNFIDTWSLKVHEPKVKIQKKDKETFEKVIRFIKELIDLDDHKRPTFEKIMLQRQKLNIKKTKMFVEERKIQKRYEPIIIKQSQLSFKQVSNSINYYDDSQNYSQKLNQITKKIKRINMMTFLLFDLTVSLESQLAKNENYELEFKYVVGKLKNLNYTITYQEYCSILKDLNHLSIDEKRQYYSKSYCNLFNNTKNNKCFLENEIEHYFHLRKQSIENAFETLKKFLDEYILKNNYILGKNNKNILMIIKIIIEIINLGPGFSEKQIQKINFDKHKIKGELKDNLQQFQKQITSSGIHIVMIQFEDND